MKSIRTLAFALIVSAVVVHASHVGPSRARDHQLAARQIFGFGDPDDEPTLTLTRPDITTTAAPTTTAAAASSSASASRASASSAAAASSSSAAVESSQSAAAASSSSRAAAASASASSASAASASSASAASATTTSAPSSTVYLTQTVVAPTSVSTSDASAASASASSSSSSSGGGVSTGLIIGVSVAGGVLILAALLFLYMKFGGKRFDGLDDNDTDIKWPELKQDPDSAAMQPLPARRTGGAGFDMGDESDNGHDGGYGASSLKGRDSFTGSTTALAAAAPGYPVNDPHYGGGMDGGYMGHQPQMQPGQYYGDMYAQNGGGAGGYSDPGAMQQYSDSNHHATGGYPNTAGGYPDTTNPYGGAPYAQAHSHINMQQNNSYRM